MQMEPLNNGGLRVLLTNEDLAQYALTFDTLDCQNESTKKALSHLLQQAHQQYQFPLCDALLIEALPTEDGCLLLITPDHSEKQVRLKRNSGPYIYEIESSDRLLQLAVGITRLYRDNCIPFIGSSSLYRYGRVYHLILYPLTPLSARLRRLLGTLATPRGQGDAVAAFSAEHGMAISVGDAVERLMAAG